jgi:ADP-ribose pyrophosphatase YjhB (NUDIX family)
VSNNHGFPEQDVPDGTASRAAPGDQTETAPSTSAVARQLHVGALAAYRHLPMRLKRFLSDRLTPSFQVAAGTVVQRDDGAILLVRLSYRKGWGLPGGLLKRNEHPRQAAARETFEELGIMIEPQGEPIVIIVPEERRITVAFRARMASGSEWDEAFPRSPEISEVAWFRLDDLPRLHTDVRRAVRELGISRR